jgi:hypothetical protein
MEVVAGPDHLHRRLRRQRDDLTGHAGGASIKAPACDVAAWVFLGLSMAGWNALISLAWPSVLRCRQAGAAQGGAAA